MSEEQKSLTQKRMLPMAEFAEMIVEQYAKKVRRLEKEFKYLLNQTSK